MAETAECQVAETQRNEGFGEKASADYSQILNFIQEWKHF